MKTWFFVFFAAIVFFCNSVNATFFVSPDTFSVLENHSNCKVIGTNTSLQAAYAALATNTKMGTLSSDNRRTLYLMPGTYVLTWSAGDTFRLSKWVDICGIGNAANVIISYTWQAGWGTAAVCTPLNASPAETTLTGVTNRLSNLTIRSSHQAVLINRSSNKTVYEFINCIIQSGQDTIYVYPSSTVNSDIYVYNCKLLAGWDNIYNANASATVNIYSSMIDCYAALGLNNINTNMQVTGMAALGGTINAYACSIHCISDASAISNSNSLAMGLYLGANGKINMYGGSIFTSATKNAGGSIQDGNAVQISSASGAAKLYGAKIVSVTNGKDLSNTVGGTLAISNDTEFNRANIEGTITYSGGIAADSTTGSSTTAAGTVGVYINGTRYWLLNSATQN